MGLLTIASEETTSSGKAFACFLYQPLSGFCFKTPQKFVTGGQADAVKSHLPMLVDRVYD